MRANAAIRATTHGKIRIQEKPNCRYVVPPMPGRGYADIIKAEAADELAG